MPAFDISTIAAGAIQDSLCQSALWGILLAVLLLFVRDKRQMLRVACWTLGLSFVGTAMAAYGAFSNIQRTATPAFADFVVGLLLVVVGFIEMYRHELLKFEPATHQAVQKIFRWLRRSTLPVLALFVSLIQPPCASGPYLLLTEALTTRPGQIIEAYLFTYLGVLYLPLITAVAAWYGLLSIPGAEHVKAQHRLLIRLSVGALTAITGLYLLWSTHAIRLLPGLAGSLS